MLLAWMAYAVVFGSLAYGAAFAVDRIAATWGRRQRFIWAGAILVAAVVPTLFAMRPRSATNAPRAATTASSTSAANIVIDFGGRRGASPLVSLEQRAQQIVAGSDTFVVGAWVLGSLVWLGLLARAAIELRRRRAHWHDVEIDGTCVLVAPTVGPAVVGAFVPRVVIPQWALSLDARARALMLRHEAEHVRARDPLLVLGGALATALFPWNPVVWLLARRLRLAIEIDCDERVLRASAQRREYGELLLTVGARRSAPLPFATSLAERRPFLERRIRAMTSLTPRHPRIVSAICLALVAIATSAAARAPRPASLVTQAVPATTPTPRLEVVPPEAKPAVTIPRPVAPVVVAPKAASVARVLPIADTAGAKLTPVPRQPVREPDTLNTQQIRELIAAHHPSALTGDPDINTITLVVDARGNYVTSLAESRPFNFDIGVGVGRGRVGGGGGRGDGAGYARGRSGGTDAVLTDSVKVMRMRDEMKALMEKLATAQGDTVALRGRGGQVSILEGNLQLRHDDSAKVMTEQRLTEAAKLAGMNGEALSRLIDLHTIDTVQIRTFPAGQMGTMPLRVFIVHQVP